MRFLRALLCLSGETVHDIRVKDRSNHEHMRHFPPRIRQLWEVRPSIVRNECGDVSDSTASQSLHFK